MIHRCHAINCGVRVPAKMLMCKKHWGMVPKKLQIEVWRTYRPGQEVDKSPSADSLVACSSAVQAVFKREKKGGA